MSCLKDEKKMKKKLSNLRGQVFFLRFKRSDFFFRFKRADFRLKRADFRPVKADFRAEMTFVKKK